MAPKPVRPNKPKPAPKKPTPKKSTNKSPSKPSTSKKKTPQQEANDAAKAAEKRAIARETASKKKAGKRFLEGAENLEKQAKALRHALSTDLAKSRDQNLTDVGTVLEGQLGQLKLGHTQRSQEFLNAARNTEKATAGQAEQGYGNLVRERQDSMSAVLEQGAGETDAMRAMVMSARNWHANASEGNRAYFDSMQSINQSIVDLNIDTRSGMANAFTAAEGERDRLWQDFYNRRSETFTQLGNIAGQKADYYAQAKEMGVKPEKGLESAAEKEMEKAFMDAAKESGKSYVQKGLPEWISGFEGQEKVKAAQSNSNLAAALEFQPIAKAEGASLRKWAA